MTIAVGQPLPQVVFRVSTPDGVEPRTTAEVFQGRTVVLFAVPGAFTPTCHRNHLPGYLEHADAILARNVDAIAVTSTNDPFVMAAWAKDTGAGDRLLFLADGNADFASAIGLSVDATERGMGIRSQRYAMVVRDGIVAHLAVEEVRGVVASSGAEAMLAALGDAGGATA
ncbi:peroxiredoxin [Lichenihabitans sp. Uapishka_5]|uniref:peroxiredoxin n=1 Tax=Lichenihabitans sp. Uapishka_5 TaxID=3037302 RepID=UPI0029E7EDF9|nr:peroxiredoxin [Lichenihabitans sp. Uapishka_5]MDX7952087.1 peroxiredoxin [Lichenihabitans sp. Uapishka_5]